MESSNRRISRSTTTAYSPSLPPKCSYTTGLLTWAVAAISSTLVPSNPFSANSLRPTSSSCSRRSFPVIRARPPERRAGGPDAAREPSVVTASSSQPSVRQPVGPRPADGGRPAQPLEEPDQPGAGVDLATQDAVPGAGRVRVVQVVPGLAHRQQRQPPDVAAAVAALERPLPEGVADRVDRPGDVVQQPHPHQRGPEERGDGPLPRPGQQAP